jgi:hypothetical protein
MDSLCNAVDLLAKNAGARKFAAATIDLALNYPFDHSEFSRDQGALAPPDHAWIRSLELDGGIPPVFPASPARRVVPGCRKTSVRCACNMNDTCQSGMHESNSLFLSALFLRLHFAAFVLTQQLFRKVQSTK